jgi:hypothetical protein
MVRFAPHRRADSDVAGGAEAPTERLPSAPVGPAGATEVLDRSTAGATADPAAHTQVIDVRPAGQVAGGVAGAPAAPRPLLSRRVAAEIGVYVGAALVAVAVGGAAARGWPDWGVGMRAGSLALAGLGLLSAGLFARLPWARPAADGRRRAVSTLLTVGGGLALAAVGVVSDVSRTASTGALVVQAGAAALAMLVVCVIARTPLSELALLGALAWGAWLLAPPGPATWAVLVGLGVGWVLLAARGARGRRTAAVSGSVLALVSSVGLAQGSWAWPVRGALAAVALAGLGMFLRGGPNPWLALGAGAATALAASVAGGVLGPALALLVGGLATMGVSAIALRGTRRDR